jgi:hypothetical protein
MVLTTQKRKVGETPDRDRPRREAADQRPLGDIEIAVSATNDPAANTTPRA